MVGGQALERLEERGLLVLDDSAQADARLSHPLLADVLLDALGPIRRRRLLRELVDAGVAPARCRVDVGDRVVRWRIDAGMDVSAGELLATPGATCSWTRRWPSRWPAGPWRPTATARPP